MKHSKRSIDCKLLRTAYTALIRLRYFWLIGLRRMFPQMRHGGDARGPRTAVSLSFLRDRGRNENKSFAVQGPHAGGLSPPPHHHALPCHLTKHRLLSSSSTSTPTPINTTHESSENALDCLLQLSDRILIPRQHERKSIRQLLRLDFDLLHLSRHRQVRETD